jgi:hypothetical protein
VRQVGNVIRHSNLFVRLRLFFVEQVTKKLTKLRRFLVIDDGGSSCGLSLLRQRIEIVSQRLKQPFFYQLLYDIKDPGARFWIVAARFKQRVQVQRVFFPRRKTSQYLFSQLVHDKVETALDIL